MARYGIPYQGSKSRIAPWIVEQLPASHTLVDIFAGGCAVTHAALLSGKWDKIIANDKTSAPQIFVDAINGEFDGYSYVPTREEFFASDDDVVKLLYSFSNNRRDYAYGKAIAPVKVAASKMVSAPSIHERRMAYKSFIEELVSYLKDNERLQGLERLQGIQSLERIQGLDGLPVLEHLVITGFDYRDMPIPEGAIVYADPPYANTRHDGYGSFNYDAFESWLDSVTFPVYVSEYTPPRGCVVIASRNSICSAQANATNKTTELLCVQERFVEDE